MKKFSVAIVAIAISMMFLALSAAPVLADQNVSHSIDATGLAKHGKGQGNGGGAWVSTEFHFYHHSSIPYPVTDEGFYAYFVVDSVVYQKNITWYEANETAGTFGVEFADGEILMGTLTNYEESSIGPGYYSELGDITLNGQVTIDGKPYSVDLAGTFSHVAWPLDGPGPS